jgi:hypothetical protein
VPSQPHAEAPAHPADEPEASAAIAPEAHETPAESAEPVAHEGREADADEQALRQVLSTGRHAMESVDRCMQLVQAIARGGVWHAVGSAVFSKSADHARLHEARDAAHEAEEGLGRFRRQVTLLRGRFGDRFHVAEVPNLADLVLDALAGPAQSESDVHQTLGRVHGAYHEVRGLCARLQLDASALRARAAAERRPCRGRRRAAGSQ